MLFYYFLELLFNYYFSLKNLKVNNIYIIKIKFLLEIIKKNLYKFAFILNKSKYDMINKIFNNKNISII